MITSPDLRTFKSLAGKGNLIALSATVPADLETPVSAYLKLAGGAAHSFLLESAEQGEKIGRYSFIGLRPQAILTAKNGRVILEKGGSRKRSSLQGLHLLDAVEKLLKDYKLANPEALPEFCGGFVGYLSYENVQDFESIRLRRKPGPEIPEGIFLFTKEFLIFDHFRKTLSIVIIQAVDGKKNPDKVYPQAAGKIAAYLRRLKQPLAISKSGAGRTPLFRSNMSPAEFFRKVHKIKNYIRAGDCIQVVFSQRFKIRAGGNDFQIYRALRSINPSPYMFYFRSGKIRLIGSSPELLVRKSGRTAEVRPIAGTRPRGKTVQEDEKLEENLKKSPKEMAEHLMLVDLGRNDLGRVCVFKSIQVKNFARIERYSHVMHLVSDVTGKLKTGKNAFDLLKAAFPAGTVSGAPKIRAMEIIDELEPQRRGPYAGCLGYFSFNQNMDMCITIRTLVSDSKHIYLQAGAGIVQDSRPEKEYQETVNKAKALLKAVEIRSSF